VCTGRFLTGWRHEGLLPKIVMCVGVIALLKGLLFLSSRAAQEVTAWVLERPVWQLKVFAAGQIVLGLAMIFGLTP